MVRREIARGLQSRDLKDLFSRVALGLRSGDHAGRAFAVDQRDDHDPASPRFDEVAADNVFLLVVAPLDGLWKAG